MGKRKGAFTKVGENLYRYSTNKVYYAVFRNKGKLIWKSLKTTDKTLARRRLETEISNQGKIDPKAAKMPLKELLDTYKNSVSGLAAKTQCTRQSILRCFERTWKHGVEMQVKEVTAAQLELWLAQHRQRLRKATYNEYLRFLRQTFELAVKSAVIVTSPATNLKELRRETPIRETPTWDEFFNIVASIRTQRFSAEASDTADLVEFMGLAGVGIAECANLRGEHIDQANGRITLYRQKTNTGYAIPIFPQVAELLRRLESNGQIQNGQSVFKVRDPKKALAAACKRLKLPNYSSRALRRCFITRAVELGVDFKTIAAWQGHHDGGVLIAKTYSHLRSEHSDTMAKKLVA